MCKGECHRVLTSQSRFFFTVENDEPIRLSITKIHSRAISSENRGLAPTFLRAEQVYLCGYFCKITRHNHLASGMIGISRIMARRLSRGSKSSQGRVKQPGNQSGPVKRSLGALAFVLSVTGRDSVEHGRMYTKIGTPQSCNCFRQFEQPMDACLFQQPHRPHAAHAPL